MFSFTPFGYYIDADVVACNAADTILYLWPRRGASMDDKEGNKGAAGGGRYPVAYCCYPFFLLVN
jgi:hypothetical protein